MSFFKRKGEEALPLWAATSTISNAKSLAERRQVLVYMVEAAAARMLSEDKAVIVELCFPAAVA